MMSPRSRIARVLLSVLLLTVGAGILLPRAALAQGQLSVQVLQLLSRVNTWIATQTVQDLRMAPAAIPSDTTNRIYADVPGNLYYNGGLIAGAGGGVTPHNLLSATHPDTLTASPTRGAVVVGNATPKWSTLVIGANGSVLRSNGTDAAWGTDASGLTNIPAANLTGTIAAISGVNLTNLNASNLASGTVNVARLANITNTQIAAGAAIAYSKLALGTSIVNADISTSAAIAYSKLALSASIVTGDIAPATLLFSRWASNGCTNLQVPQYNGASWVCKTLLASDISGGGTVTSVALSLPGIFTVSGSPVTGSGTLTGTLASQTQNLMFASPNGSSGAPTFRAFLNADLPTSGVVAGSNSLVTVNDRGIVTTLAQANIVSNTTGTLTTARGGTSLTAATDDNVMVGNGTNWAAQLLPNCVAGALNYTQATNLFSCNTTTVAPHTILSATHTDTLADTVVAGDLIFGNATPKWARLAKGSNGQFLTLTGGLPAWAQTPVKVAHNTAAYTAVNTTAAETNLGTTTDLLIPAGFLNGTGRRLAVDLRGVYGTNGAGDTLTLRLKLCTVSGCGSGTVVTLASSHAASPAGAETNRGWSIDTTCNTFTTGATGTMDCQGWLLYGTSATNGNLDDMDNTATSTVDLTVDQYVNATVQFNNSNINNTITLRGAAIQVY